MRTGYKWALPAVLALTVAAPTFADPPTTPARPPDLATQLQVIANDLSILRKEVEALRRDVTSMAVQGAGATVDLRSIKERLDALEAIVNRQDDALRRFYFNPAAPAATPPPPPPAPSAGTIVLRNYSRVTGTFYINEQAYVVPPGGAANVERVPAGTFNYEIATDVYGLLRGLTTRYLRPGQTFYINIDPQP
jgi:hypothetical protein